MAARPGGFNATLLTHASMITANNNAVHNQGNNAVQVPTFYGGSQDPITYMASVNELNLACTANGSENTNCSGVS